MSKRYSIDRTYHSMTIKKCPRFGVFEHYVFMCLTNCAYFKGIVEGDVVCDYGDEK